MCFRKTQPVRPQQQRREDDSAEEDIDRIGAAVMAEKLVAETGAVAALARAGEGVRDGTGATTTASPKPSMTLGDAGVAGTAASICNLRSAIVAPLEFA